MSKTAIKAESKSLSQRLKALRMQKGMSQKEFANLVKLAYAQYNRYERGDTLPSTETITKLADALDVSVDYLLEGEEKDAAIANFEDQDLLRLFRQIEEFPSDRKEHVKFVLEALVRDNQYQQIAQK